MLLRFSSSHKVHATFPYAASESTLCRVVVLVDFLPMCKLVTQHQTLCCAIGQLLPSSSSLDLLALHLQHKRHCCVRESCICCVLLPLSQLQGCHAALNFSIARSTLRKKYAEQTCAYAGAITEQTSSAMVSCCGRSSLRSIRSGGT